jgi:hypothetical protein
MNKSLQIALPPMEVEALSQARETPHPAQGERVSLTALLAQTASEFGLQEKLTADTMGVDPRYWSRIKAGEKKAHLDPVADFPEHVQRAFVTKWARMLKMNVSEQDATKRAVMDLAKAALAALEHIA